MKKVIGIDLDNTIICYDELLFDVAFSKGLIEEHICKNKKTIRDEIRKSISGEIEWQKIQADIYGPLILKAKVFNGVKAFFNKARDLGYELYIISHKTRFASYDKQNIDLRKAAMGFLRAHGFFSSTVSGLREERVFFKSTRKKKIEKIKELGCTHFIDDLEETFMEPDFPVNVRKILFGFGCLETQDLCKVCSTWKDIEKAVLYD